MTRRWLIPIFVLLLALVTGGQTAEQEAQQELHSGEKISTALATVTSTAISPLVGVSVMGIWRYYRTPPGQRDELPLIQKPKFWISIIVLLILIFIKLALARLCRRSRRVCRESRAVLTDGFALKKMGH